MGPRNLLPMQINRTETAYQHKLNCLADTVSGVKAHLLCQLQALDEKVTAKSERSALHRCYHQPHYRLHYQPHNHLHLQLPVHRGQRCAAKTRRHPMRCQWSPQLLFQGSVILTGSQGDYFVVPPPNAVNSALQACRSRRNLAARLAAKIFAVPERSGRNCRCVVGKKAVDIFKVKAIYDACMQQFPCRVLRSG